MKECTSCGYRCDDSVEVCPQCCDTQFVRICPSCSSPLDGEMCPVCGYVTDAALARSSGNAAKAAYKPLEDKKADADLAIIHAVLSIFACGVPLFSIPAIIYAVKAMKSGEDFRKVLISLIIVVLSIVELLLVIELYVVPIHFG